MRFCVSVFVCVCVFVCFALARQCSQASMRACVCACVSSFMRACCYCARDVVFQPVFESLYVFLYSNFSSRNCVYFVFVRVRSLFVYL